MTKNFITISILTLFSLSLNATEPGAKSYLSFEKLNENIYSVKNEDKILALGLNIKSSEKVNFIIAYEGGIYNEKNNAIATDPIYKVSSYIDSGALSYKLNYKF